MGCLFVLMIIVAGFYYGVDVGETYYRYYQMVDAMKAEARFAVNVDNGTIRRRLRAKADELGLPDAAHEFDIRRTSRPREIIISANWTQVLVLPFYNYEVAFSPEVRFPL